MSLRQGSAHAGEKEAGGIILTATGLSWKSVPTDENHRWVGGACWEQQQPVRQTGCVSCGLRPSQHDPRASLSEAKGSKAFLLTEKSHTFKAWLPCLFKARRDSGDQREKINKVAFV